MTDEGRLLFAISVDIDPEVEDEWNEWYNSAHLPTVVGCPLYVAACRYKLERETAGMPRYWAVYEIESKEALRTPELQAIAGFGRFEPHIRNTQRHFFRSLVPIIRHEEVASR